jgi:hypothetical protein
MTDEDRRRLKGSGGGTEPLAAPINEASRLSGLSRSEFYRRLAAGDIQAVKSGSRTLILMASLRAHLASLPPATFRAPRKIES